MSQGPPELVAISVGNTRTRIGFFRAGKLEQSEAVANDELVVIASAVNALPLANPSTPVVMASVNNPVADRIELALEPALRGRGSEMYRFGSDLSIPIENSLEDDSTVGQDRLLNALGAYSRAKQACVIVDCGTATVVDFVDGEGVFQGGAIAPGLNTMLRALHEHTAALPQIAFEPVPDSEPFGKDTRRAMLLGVQSAIRGMVRVLSERYAEFYEAYPQIIATGGDARVLFESDDLIEHIVPDLTLLGIEAACRIQLEQGDGGQDDSAD